VVRLVTPKLNDHFYVFRPPDRKEAVDPGQFRYEDNPARIVFLQKKAGVLTTKEDFENYRMHFWFRWREKQWGFAEGKPRRAGLLLHITGSDGAFENGIYPECIFVLLGEDETGSLSLMGAPKRIQCVSRVQDSTPVRNRAVQAADALSFLTQSGTSQAVGAGPAPYLVAALGAALAVIEAKQNPDRLRREYVGEDGKAIPIVTGEPPGWDLRILRRGFPPDAIRGRGGLFVDFPAGWHPEGDLTLPRSRSAPASGPTPWSWS
jgi:hypothetical protein